MKACTLPDDRRAKIFALPFMLTKTQVFGSFGRVTECAKGESIIQQGQASGCGGSVNVWRRRALAGQ